MDPILADLRDHVATLPVHPPSIPIASNFQADYFAKHCRQPVSFARGLRELEQYLDPSQIEAWIDFWPNCTEPLFLWIGDASLTNASLVLALICRRIRSTRRNSGRLLAIVRSTRQLEPTLQRRPPGHPMLTSWSQHPSRQNGNAAIFETPISCLASYMEGHRVGGYALCPASVYLEQALAGAVITQRYMELDFGRCMPVLRSVEFSRPLVLRGEIRLIILIHVTVHEDGTWLVQHYLSSVRETTSNLALELPGVVRRAEGITCQDQAPEVFSAKCYLRGGLSAGRGGAFGVARIALSGSLSIQPVFLDTMLHVAGFMVNLRGDVSDAYICSSVGLLKALRDLVDDKQPYTVYCTNNWISSRDFVTADIVAVQECDPPVVVAQLRGAQFRRVRLTSLHRGLAIAADPGVIRNRTRTDSNSIITPSSPRSVIFGRSRSNTLSTMFRSTGPGVDNCRGIIYEWAAYAANIMADVLGITDSEEIKDDADFGSLGLDSLGSIEAQQALRVALNRPIPHNIFAECSTLSALCDFLVDDLNGADVSDGKIYDGESLTVRLLPLYLVHDGSGLVSHYERLLPLHRDVWGLSNPRFFSGDPWETLEEMAQGYAQTIEQHAHDGALMLGGWSFGGAVAFEIAQILTSRGVQVKGVVLIDSPSPSAPPLLSDALIDHLLCDQERTADSGTTSLVVRQFKQNTALLDAYTPSARDGETARAVSLAFLRSTVGFSPDGVPDVPAWFRERGDAMRGQIVGPWEALVGEPIPVWDVPGHHFEPFSRVYSARRSRRRLYSSIERVGYLETF
ncbi:hypothetical protein EV363DRAFT_1453999 [Boletus edulis]|nr:hypothetical protein EV363DRAFT_1453999 [Boletus edulis]